MCPFCRIRITSLNVAGVADVSAEFIYEYDDFADEDEHNSSEFYYDYVEVAYEDEVQPHRFMCPECGRIVAEDRIAAERLLKLEAGK